MKDEEILDMVTAKVEAAENPPAKKKRVVKRTEAQRAGENRYKKAKQKRLSVSFFPPDYDIYEFAKNQAEKSSINAYVKSLIRKDMENRE